MNKCTLVGPNLVYLPKYGVLLIVKLKVLVI